MFQKIFTTFFIVSLQILSAQNQTSDLSPLLSPNSLPFRITISLSDFQLPSDVTNSYGLQSFVWGTYDNKWILLAGRTNGLHGFANDTNNFPPRQQNTSVIVVDPNKKQIFSRSLQDPSAQLSQAVVDTLSVTAPEFKQTGNTLYMIGGYGVDSSTGQFSTKSVLTAIDIPGLMGWVQGANSSAAPYIRQTSHPLAQVTGGALVQATPHQPYLLVFGQNFAGYYLDSSNGNYTQQIRPFRIIDNGQSLYLKPENTFTPNPNYRRRDLNVVPTIQRSGNNYIPSFVVLSGVFTLQTGVWTVPVFVNGDGSSYMPDPNNPTTFKQGVNNYECARLGMYSKQTNDMYILLFGGMSYLTVSDGSLVPDSEIPFVNTVTTVRIDSSGNCQQYLMDSQYPTILSTFSNPGNTLLFGSEARFIRANQLPYFPNGVFSLDEVGASPVLLGYIVGGIQSTLGNTNFTTDSAASPYIFSVYVQRR